MRFVFSVIVSALRFLIGGILTRDGSILKGRLVEELCLLEIRNLVRIWYWSERTPKQSKVWKERGSQQRERVGDENKIGGVKVVPPRG
jgi:hypothetical protein